MYQIGEKIVYPMHGAGIIESVEEKTVMGKKQSYYILKIATSSMKVSLPVDSCDKIGVRYVMSREAAAELLDYFRNAKTSDNVVWNRRQRENISKIKSGDMHKIACVLKELMCREAKKGLSTGERKLLNGTKQIIVSELVLSGLAVKEELDEIMEDIIEEEIS